MNKNEKRKLRFENNPELLEAYRKQRAEYERTRYANDPVHRKRKAEYTLKVYNERPEIAEKKRQKSKEYRERLKQKQL